MSVWIALSNQDTVTLTVRGSDDVVATSPATAAVPLGQAPPVNPPDAVGRLFVALLTAIPSVALQPEQTYTYDLSFTTKPSLQAALGLDSLAKLSYMPAGTNPAPSFSLPPKTLNLVNIAHASCRKASGQAADAFPVLDFVMGKAMNGPNPATGRIHQLLLTGDQFYADDVAPQFLAMCIDAAGWLMGAKKEKPPTQIGPLATTPWVASDWDTGGFPDDYTKTFPWDVADPWPGVGARGHHIFGAGFTVTPPDRLMSDPLSERIPMRLPDPDVTADGYILTDKRFDAAANHLMLLGEFYASYLLSWSPALWPQPVTDLPVLTNELYDPLHKREAQSSAVSVFGQGLDAVRRLLANVPTYMIFDDHDVTDDWYMNREWCNRVLSQKGDTLGRRVVRNALIAYAIFQAWGNTPKQFTGQQPGAKLLAKLASGAELTRDFEPNPPTPTAADLVGMPDPLAAPQPGATTSALTQRSDSLTWNYRWAPAGWPYELIVLDCRTVRGYLGKPLAPPLLLDDGDGGRRTDQTTQQIPAPDVVRGTGIVTVVVIQTPLLGMLLVDGIASSRTGTNAVFENDVESWSATERAQQAVLARLVEHNAMTVVLSGDVHYAFGLVADYWALRPWRAPAPLSSPRTGRIVQLVSSAARNEQWKTEFVHRTGPLSGALMGRFNSQTILGWNADPGLSARALASSLRASPIDLMPKPTLRPPFLLPDLGPWPLATKPADWKYRIRPVVASGVVGPTVSPIETLPPDASLLARGIAAIQDALHDVALTLSEPVVGDNNVCVVGFTGTGPADWTVTQTFYTRPKDPTGRSTVPNTTTLIGTPLQYIPDTQW